MTEEEGYRPFINDVLNNTDMAHGFCVTLQSRTRLKYEAKSASYIIKKLKSYRDCYQHYQEDAEDQINYEMIAKAFDALITKVEYYSKLSVSNNPDAKIFNSTIYSSTAKNINVEAKDLGVYIWGVATNNNNDNQSITRREKYQLFYIDALFIRENNYKRFFNADINCDVQILMQGGYFTRASLDRTLIAYISIASPNIYERDSERNITHNRESDEEHEMNRLASVFFNQLESPIDNDYTEPESSVSWWNWLISFLPGRSPIDDYKNLCSICYTREAIISTVPCGHLSMCNTCCRKTEKSQCIICRQPVEKYIRIYRQNTG